MKFYQFRFTSPGQTLKVYIAAPSMAIARIVARDRVRGYTLADLADAVETRADDAEAAGHFLTSEGWQEITEYGWLASSLRSTRIPTNHRTR
jgi:hypothetical protein